MDIQYYEFVKRLDGTHRQVTEHGKFGIVDDNGMITAPIRYDEIILRCDGNFDVRIDNRWGIINIDGDEIVSISYKSPICFKEEGYAIVESADCLAVGVIKNDGTVIIPVKYSCIHEVKDSLCIDPCEFEIPLFYVHQLMKETDWDDEQDDRIGVYNLRGEMVVPIKYRGIKVKSSYLIGQRENGHCDLYNGANNSGLLIGGFRLFEFHNNRLFFCFGGYYTSWTDRHDEDHDVYVAYGNVWIFTDKELTSILKDDKGCRRNLKGKVYDLHYSNNWQEINSIFPECMTVNRDSKTVFLIGKYIKERQSYAMASWTDYAGTYLIDSETGECSNKFHDIERTGIEDVFYALKSPENTGILQGIQIVMPTIYFAFTKPVIGYCFGAKKIDEDKYDIELINLNNIVDIRIAYKDLSRSEVLELFWNQNLLIYPLEGEEGTKAIRIIKTEKIDKDFEKAISSEMVPPERPYRNYSNWNDRYWFPDHFYMKDEEEEDSDEDGSDYRDTMWTNQELRDAVDIAYEGYSPLYLGLED